jgi:hypothetical protein
MGTAQAAAGGQLMGDFDSMGPIDYLVVEFVPGRITGEALPLLVDLVNRGVIRILDLALVRTLPDGSIRAIDPTELDGDTRRSLAAFDGAASGLLGADDLAEAAGAVTPGRVAVILLYENSWAAPFATALRRSGAQLVASGRIPVQAILAQLDDMERAAS